MRPHSAEETLAARRALGLPDEQFPRSVAIIMDGNGRWARQRNLPRPLGHQAGAKTVSRIVTEAARLGLDNLALYSFSIENWNRPKEEVDALMSLYAEYLIHERPTVMANNIRLRHLGRREGLPDKVLKELDESMRVSSTNTGMFLSLAINYGSRAEIIDSVQRIAKKVAAGQLKPEDIDTKTVDDNLDTHGIPDPDLLIRTAGELRVSNFLLWQISYSEFYVTDVHWPDFTEEEFHKALLAYGCRHRRFGGVDESNK